MSREHKLSMNANSFHFGVKAAGGVLVTVLISQIFSDYFLAKFLRYLQETYGSDSLWLSGENEIFAARAVIHGVTDPLLIMVVCLFLLKSYFKSKSISEIVNIFGVEGRPSNKLLVGGFLCGAAYFLIFSTFLMQLFPADEFAAPHPLNVVNYSPLWGKVMLAIAVVTIVPISEEFLFRGVLYQGISNSWGKLASGICVSVVFILLHPMTIESGYWLTHMALYLFPLYMILLREFTGALFAPIMAHAGFNFTEILF